MDYMENRTFSLETDSPFLLENIFISSVQGIIVAMVFALVVAVVFHTLNFVIHFRERHPFKRKSNMQHCVTTAVHVVSAILAYIMVYCVRTMNVWLFTAIVLGSGIGQLVFGPFVSIYLERKRRIKREEENEPLCDDVPKIVSFKNDTITSPRAGPSNEDSGWQPVNSNKSSRINASPIKFDDFVIHKSANVGQSDYNKSPNIEDADRKSEYDNLDAFSGDSKLLDETNL